MKKLLTINLLLFAFASSALVFAQSQGTQTEDGCRRFRTPVRKASDDLDKDMLTPDNSGQTLAKGIVVDPCRNPRVQVRSKVTPLNEFPVRPSVERFLEEKPAPKLRLKTPSEVLRDTTQSKPNQPNQ